MSSESGRVNNSPKIVVSDESGTDGSLQYQSIAFVSGDYEQVREFNKTCKNLLTESGLSELKWSKIGKGRMLPASKQALTAFVKQSSLRVLVLTWNTKDRRHNIPGRDDQANFHRMLYHGLRRNCDWHKHCHWRWFHDIKSDLKQDEITQYLNGTKEDKGYTKHPKLFVFERSLLRFNPPEQRCSQEVPIIGIADLFAGIVRESCHSGDAMHQYYLEALRVNEPCLELDLADQSEVGRGERARLELGAHLYSLGKEGKHRLSLRQQGRFETPDPRGRFFFWHYEPKSEHDRAPKRAK